MNALILASSASIRARHRRANSSAEMLRRRIAAAASTSDRSSRSVNGRQRFQRRGNIFGGGGRPSGIRRRQSGAIEQRPRPAGKGLSRFVPHILPERMQDAPFDRFTV
jgi:hypothetical protein